MRYCPAAAAIAANASYFQELLQQWQPPSWTDGINEHWAKARQAALVAARDAFKADAVPKRDH
eukprot:2993755-Lingulodinium_polyedra.AAC.1